MPTSALDAFVEENKALFDTACTGKRNQKSSSLTTFGIGGDVSLLLEPQSLAGLRDTLGELQKRSLEWRTLGAGSNVVLPDSGLEIPILRFGREFSAYRVVEDYPRDSKSLEEVRTSAELDLPELPKGESLRVIAFCAAPLMKLSRVFSEAGYSGLEFAAGIPASLGGAIAMNAGAHSSQISEIVEKVYYLDENYTLRVIFRDEAGFDYRVSRFPHEGLVLAAGLRLIASDKEAVREKRRTCLDYRKNTQPLNLPSAGSVFKNPEGKINDKQKVFAAQLIEHVGLKGFSQGGVGFSDMHANWLVKLSDEATTADFLTLVRRAQDAVFKEFSIKLKTEIKIW